MEKGDRVTITGGKQGRGKSGTIFWKGQNKYGPGERYGVNGDDGSTYWVTEDNVERSAGTPPELPADDRTYEKGERVAFDRDGDEQHGSVFWTGKSRAGGQRLGVRREPDGETVWIDARFVRPATAAPPVAQEAVPTFVGDDTNDEGYLPEAYVQGDPGDVPPEAPIDDAAMDAWARSSIDEDEPPPW